MHYARAAVLALLLAPSFALGAGFAKQSLFLSKSPVTEGEQVLVHAVVQNDAAAAFDGNLVFSVKADDKKTQIGSVAVAIVPGGAQAASVSWKPTAGEHEVVASLTQKDGTIVEEESATFSIAKKPTAAVVRSNPVDDSSPVESSDAVEAMIVKFIPPIAGLAEPVFSGIDTFRTKANDLINSGIGWSKNKIGGKSAGEVLGSATAKENTTPKGIIGTVIFLAAMVSLYILSILKWMVAHTGVFYPAAVILFLFALWKLSAGMRRPRY